MNRLFYLMVFAVCLAASYGIFPVVQAAPSVDSSEQLLVSRDSFHRVVRQAENPEDEIPPPPPEPQRFVDNFSRKKRAAKGGGSMPTRKG